MRCYPHFILPMRRSRGFASTADNPIGRPLQTRFRSGSAAEPLNLAADRKSPDHYAKGTPSGIPQKQTTNSRQGTADSPVFAGAHRLGGDKLPHNPPGRGRVPARLLSTVCGLLLGHSPPTACKRVVSGSVSSPGRGSSHRSLALLVHYRSPEST